MNFKGLLVACPLMALSSVANATCNFNTGYFLQERTIPLTSTMLSVPVDAVAGTVLATGETPAAQGEFASCTGSNSYSYSANGSSVTAGGLTYVFPTNISGIGIRFYRRNDQGTNFTFANNNASQGQDTSTSWTWYRNGNFFWGAHVVTTGGVVGNGTFDGTLNSSFSVGGPQFVLNHVTQFTVQSRACTQTSPSTVSLALPPVALGDFGATGLPTANDKSRSFNLVLSCSYGIKVNLSVASNGGAVSDVLANSTAPGMAQGIGIQLFSGASNSTSVLPLNTKRLVNTTAASGENIPVSIPITANYYKTGNLTTGLVNVSTTYTLTYE